MKLTHGAATGDGTGWRRHRPSNVSESSRSEMRESEPRGRLPAAKVSRGVGLAPWAFLDPPGMSSYGEPASSCRASSDLEFTGIGTNANFPHYWDAVSRQASSAAS